MPARAAAGLAPLLALLVAFAPAAARADAAGDADRAAARARQAEARAAAAAFHVTELTSRYTETAAGVRQAMADLARAFAAADEAQSRTEDARDRLARARTDRARAVRALYADGGSVFAASVLSAPTPEDALWRMATSRRVMADLVADAQSEVALSQGDVTATAARQRDSDAATDERAAALDRLQADSAAAQALLDQAHAGLAALDEDARRAKVTAEAAAALAAAEASARAAQRAVSRTVTSAAGIPQDYAAAYQQFASTCSGLRWTLLAAVGQVESGHGRNNGPSSAGAIGPMQFMPATFAAYGVDGDGDGTKDAWDPQDAIASAANYLCASGIDGSPAGDQRALLAYNHAQWYVDLVVDAEAAIVAAQTRAVQTRAAQTRAVQTAADPGS